MPNKDNDKKYKEFAKEIGKLTRKQKLDLIAQMSECNMKSMFFKAGKTNDKEKEVIYSALGGCFSGLGLLALLMDED